MNKKGSYAGSIVVLAVVVLAAMALGSNMAWGTQTLENASDKIIETKSAWQNARIVLDRAATDAVYDDVAWWWAIKPESIEERANGYFNTVLINGETTNLESIKKDLNCTKESNPSVSANGNDLTIQITFSCEKSTPSFFSKYKKTVVFKKRVFVGSGIDIMDIDSGVCEVDGWFGGGCGN